MTKLEMAIYVNLIAKEPLVKMVLKPDREPLVEYIGDIYYSTAYNKQADAREDLEYLLNKLLLLMP